MSYDLRFYREENKRKQPLTKDELSKLHEKFETTILHEDSEGRVLEFTIKYKDNQPEWLEDGFEISYQDTEELDAGDYATYISYSANDEMFDYFGKLTADLARVLHWKIEDPQVGSKLMEPDVYANYEEKSDKLFVYQPAESTFFIKFFIQSWDSKENRQVILLENGNQIYCSKVVKGQSIYDVLKKEVPPLIGSAEFLVISTTDTEDYDYDKHGNKLNRINVFIEVTYFDPKSRNLKYNMQWV